MLPSQSNSYVTHASGKVAERSPRQRGGLVNKETPNFFHHGVKLLCISRDTWDRKTCIQNFRLKNQEGVRP